MTEGTQVSSGKETKTRTGPVKMSAPRTKSQPPQCLAQPIGSRALRHVHPAPQGAGRDVLRDQAADRRSKAGFQWGRKAQGPEGRRRNALVLRRSPTGPLPPGLPSSCGGRHCPPLPQRPLSDVGSRKSGFSSLRRVWWKPKCPHQGEQRNGGGEASRTNKPSFLIQKYAHHGNAF